MEARVCGSVIETLHMHFAPAERHGMVHGDLRRRLRFMSKWCSKNAASQKKNKKKNSTFPIRLSQGR